MIELNNDEIKKVKKLLHDSWEAKNNLQTNVKLSAVGLEELLESVKKAKEAMNSNEVHISWLDEVKSNYDTIAYLMQQFNSEFALLYEEMSVKHITETLVSEENKKLRSDNSITINSAGINTHAFGSVSFGETKVNSGWKK